VGAGDALQGTAPQPDKGFTYRESLIRPQNRSACSVARQGEWLVAYDSGMRDPISLALLEMSQKIPVA
jgi:hypothetical protein